MRGMTLANRGQKEKARFPNSNFHGFAKTEYNKATFGRVMGTTGDAEGLRKKITGIHILIHIATFMGKMRALSGNYNEGKYD
jgi:hypothetical protein